LDQTRILMSVCQQTANKDENENIETPTFAVRWDDDLMKEYPLGVTDCGHVFHCACFERWSKERHWYQNVDGQDDALPEIRMKVTLCPGCNTPVFTCDFRRIYGTTFHPKTCNREQRQSQESSVRVLSVAAPIRLLCVAARAFITLEIVMWITLEIVTLITLAIVAVLWCLNHCKNTYVSSNTGQDLRATFFTKSFSIGALLAPGLQKALDTTTNALIKSEARRSILKKEYERLLDIIDFLKEELKNTNRKLRGKLRAVSRREPVRSILENESGQYLHSSNTFCCVITRVVEIGILGAAIWPIAMEESK
jgi:hypothetical protein